MNVKAAKKYGDQNALAISRLDFLLGAAALVSVPFIPAFAVAPGALSNKPGTPPETTEIAPGVYVHQGRYEISSPQNEGDIANCTFIVGNQSVAVIDTGGSATAGRRLLAAIRTVTDKPIGHVINSHMHPDHVLGNVAFEPDQPTFTGHFKLPRALAARAEHYLAANKQLLGEAAFADTKIIPPTLLVQDRLEIDLGGRTLVLEAQPTAHTDNDLVIRDQATDTMIVADLVFSGHIPTLDGSIRGWLALLDKLSTVPAARIVPGHGPASMDWPVAAAPIKHYLSVVASDVRRMIKDGKTLAEAAKTSGQSERDNWQLFDEFNARNVAAAYAELEWE